MKNTIYLILKVLFVLKVFKFLFKKIKKRLDQKSKGSFKIYGVTTWLTKNDDTYIAEYLTK